MTLLLDNTPILGWTFNFVGLTHRCFAFLSILSIVSFYDFILTTKAIYYYFYALKSLSYPLCLLLVYD